MDPVALVDLLSDIPHCRRDVSETLTVTGVCTDTRKLRPGDLFFALKGENHDGNRFVKQAMEFGAVAAVASESTYAESRSPLVLVTDTTRTLGLVARNYRRQFQIPVVAITGSVGKTSVKDMTTAALRTSYHTLATRKNLNNEFGVPLTLFELTREHEVAVLEMGMRLRGEIDWLAEVAEPTIGLITNIGHSHIERLGSREEIARAKAELLARIRPTGVAILPRHDPFFGLLRAYVPGGCRVITFSDSHSDSPDVVVEIAPKDSRLKVMVGGVRQQFADPFAGPGVGHTARNAAAALAVGLALNIPVGVALSGLESLAPVEGRLRWLPGLSGTSVLDDCYNAAPESMSAALEVLGMARSRNSAGQILGRGHDDSGADGRLVAILGDMRELGAHGPELHRAVGRQAVKAEVEVLVTVGELAAEIGREAERFALDAGGPLPHVVQFADSTEAASEISSILKPCDRILVKGSRAMQMEKIVAALTGVSGTDAHG